MLDMLTRPLPAHATSCKCRNVAPLVSEISFQLWYLVGAAYEVEVVLRQELGDAVWAKSVADTAIVFAPTLDT